MPFIGHNIELPNGVIYADRSKQSRIEGVVQSLAVEKDKDYDMLCSLIGKLGWYATLGQRLMATFDGVYPDLRPIGSYFESSRSPKPKLRFPLTPNLREELSHITYLLPLAIVKLDLPISRTVVAFDASVRKGVVKYTRTSEDDGRKLWHIGISREAKGEIASNLEPFIEDFVARSRWLPAIVRKWEGAPYEARDINFLEAAAGTMTTDWTTRTTPGPYWHIILSGNTYTMMALRKGCSGKEATMRRCRPIPRCKLFTTAP